MKPFCCKKEAVWVDHGKWCQYWYCRECQNEVVDSQPQITLSQISFDSPMTTPPPQPLYFKPLPPHIWQIKTSPATCVNCGMDDLMYNGLGKPPYCLGKP